VAAQESLGGTFASLFQLALLAAPVEVWLKHALCELQSASVLCAPSSISFSKGLQLIDLVIL